MLSLGNYCPVKSVCFLPLSFVTLIRIVDHGHEPLLDREVSSCVRPFFFIKVQRCVMTKMPITDNPGLGNSDFDAVSSMPIKICRSPFHSPSKCTHVTVSVIEYCPRKVSAFTFCDDSSIDVFQDSYFYDRSRDPFPAIPSPLVSVRRTDSARPL